MDEAVGRERVDTQAADAVQRIVDNLAVVVHAPEETLRLVVLCRAAKVVRTRQPSIACAPK